MFFKLLNKIRKKPEHTKQLIALGLSAGVTGIITLFWVASFVPEFGESIRKTSLNELATPFNKMHKIFFESNKEGLNKNENESKIGGGNENSAGADRNNNENVGATSSTNGSTTGGAILVVPVDENSLEASSTTSIRSSSTLSSTSSVDIIKRNK